MTNQACTACDQYSAILCRSCVKAIRAEYEAEILLLKAQPPPSEPESVMLGAYRQLVSVAKAMDSVGDEEIAYGIRDVLDTLWDKRLTAEDLAKVRD